MNKELLQILLKNPYGKFAILAIVVLVTMSFIRVATASNLNLGGAGGNAPGAGGGGGAAFGPNARGGEGGPGGTVRYEGVHSVNGSSNQIKNYFSPGPVQINPRIHNLQTHENVSYDSNPGAVPGAGGGGGAAEGPNTVGGQGGGGGEIVHATILAKDLAELKKAGFDHCEIGIGAGGIGGKSGMDGNSGGNTVLNFVTADGKILRTINAQGGIGGKAGSVRNNITDM